MKNYFGKRLIYFIIQIIILTVVVVVLKVNKGFNKYNNTNYNNMTQEQRQAEAQRRLLDIVGKYRKTQLEEFYKRQIRGIGLLLKMSIFVLNFIK
ncbi:MAG: hypothetical protein HG453_000510 [Clostridiales bacterium]|nr:hypothetical protein [Clostridiales bacterium]